MADVQVAVRFRRKPRLHAAAEFAGVVVFFDEGFDEVEGTGRFVDFFVLWFHRLGFLAPLGLRRFGRLWERAQHRFDALQKYRQVAFDDLPHQLPFDPRYRWIRVSRIPAICFQGTSGVDAFTTSDRLFVASPMISIFRMTA